MLVRLLPCLIGLLFTVPALAQDEEEPPPPCTPASAETVTIEQLDSDFRDWAGRCVTVQGLHAIARYATQVSVFASPEAALAGGPGLAINYHNPADEHAPHAPRWEEITGTFGSCVIQYEWLHAAMARDPNVFPMLGGLCHYTLDAHYIVPVSYAPSIGPVPARPHRSDVPLEQRQFEPLDVTDQPDFAGRASFEQMLTVLGSYSFEEYFALTDPRQAEEYEDLTPLDLDPEDLEELAEHYRHFEALRETWRSFRPQGDPRLFVMQDVRMDRTDPAAPVATIEDMAQTWDRMFCVLRQGYEPGAFPVRWADIDNQPSRPYFCALVYSATSPEEPYSPWVTVPSNLAGFPETAE